MRSPSLRPAPYLSLRHARAGRLNQEGRLPPGWRGEHVENVEVLEIDFVEGKPSAVIRLELDGASAGWGGLSLSPHLTAPKQAVVALAGQVILSDWTNIAGALLVLREWRPGGDLARQSTEALQLAEEPQVAAIALEVGEEGGIVQPLLMISGDALSPSGVTVTLTGFAFGALHDHPRWLWA